MLKREILEAAIISAASFHWKRKAPPPRASLIIDFAKSVLKRLTCSLQGLLRAKHVCLLVSLVSGRCREHHPIYFSVFLGR